MTGRRTQSPPRPARRRKPAPSAHTLDHACLFSDDTKESWAIRAGFVSASLRGKSRVLIIGDMTGREVLRRLRIKAKDQVQIERSSVYGLDAEPVALTTFAALMRQRIQAANGSPLVVIVDMRWALRTPTGTAFLDAYEEAVEALVAEGGVAFLCCYDVHVFTDTHLTLGLHTHPAIYAPAGARPNPHFLPPAILLHGDSRQRLQHWLGAIDPALSLLPRPGGADLSGDRRQASSMGPLTIGAPQAALDPWRVKVLGRLSIERNDGSEVSWDAPGGSRLKIKALFAYLLTKGSQGASADEIATLLWPAAEEGPALRNRVHHTLHGLRVALAGRPFQRHAADFIIRDGNHYLLALPANSWIDARVFEDLCHRSSKLAGPGDEANLLTVLQAADSVYRGDLYGDVPIDYADTPDNDWCWSRRLWLRRMAAKMERWLALVHRERDDLHLAMVHCRKSLDLDPDAEEVHQELLRIYRAQGRIDAVRRHYRLYTQSLERSHGVSPSAAMERLYATLIDPRAR